MAWLPDSLAIALWVTGSCWTLALLAYFLGESTEWVLPLFMLGILTGIAECSCAARWSSSGACQSIRTAQAGAGAELK